MTKTLLIAMVSAATGCQPLTGWTLAGSGHSNSGSATVSWDGGSQTINCTVTDAGPGYPPAPGYAILYPAMPVLMLGDSITGVSVWQQYMTASIDGEFDWAHTTRPIWYNAGFNGATVSPRTWAAFPGAGTYLDSAHQYLLNPPYAPTSPGIIVLFIGVNDVIAGRQANAMAPTPDAEFESYYNQLLNALHAKFPVARVIVVGPWLAGDLKPDGRYYATRPDGSNQLDGEMDAKNTIVKRVCAQRGINFVDVRGAWFDDGVIDWTVLNGDQYAVHPSGSGDVFLGEIVREQAMRVRM